MSAKAENNTLVGFFRSGCQAVTNGLKALSTTRRSRRQAAKRARPSGKPQGLLAQKER